MQTQPFVFNLLAEPVRKVLAELGFSEPTLPQSLAFPAMLEGENVLLVAPTESEGSVPADQRVLGQITKTMSNLKKWVGLR